MSKRLGDKSNRKLQRRPQKCKPKGRSGQRQGQKQKKTIQDWMALTLKTTCRKS